MDAEEIRREVVRLSPWYFRFDLRGVRTDITPSLEGKDHRDVHFPEVREGFWRGKRVLDVGCNEGAYSFAALDQGAAHVDAFDVRASNIEKAEFVARVLGYEGVDFHVAALDDWLDAGHEPYDHVVCCGILYHLVEPWEAIRRLCGCARETILATCVLYGGEEVGYTRYAELENDAASADSLDSEMPNNTATLIEEFAKHGFHPVHVSETRGGDMWGGCNLLLRRVDAHHGTSPQPPYPRAFDLHLVPETPEEPEAGGRSRPLDLRVSIYNWSPEVRRVEGRLALLDGDGRVVRELGRESLELEARVDRKGDLASRSRDVLLELDLSESPEAEAIRLELTDPQDGSPLASRELSLGAG